MKKIRFKSRKINIKTKVVIVIITIVFSCAFLTHFITHKLSDSIILYAKKIIKRDNDLIFKKAYNQKLLTDIDTRDLIELITNSKDEIVAVDFDIQKSEKIMFSIINVINEATDNINADGYRFDVSVGYLSNSPLFVNLGPKLPIKVMTSDIALGSIKTTLREYGINNCLVEIYMTVTITYNLLSPLEKEEQKIDYEALVASKIIVGKIPNFYNGNFTTQSETINLPIEE